MALYLQRKTNVIFIERNAQRQLICTKYQNNEHGNTYAKCIGDVIDNSKTFENFFNTN